VLETLISIGSLMLDLFKAKSMQDETSSQELQDALYDIGVLLDDLAADLESGVYPHGKCAQMEMLALNLHDEYLEILKNNLNSAVEIEKMYAYKDDPNQLDKLRMAAGYFRAAAILSTI
jgi:hypothetical protein